MRPPRAAQQSGSQSGGSPPQRPAGVWPLRAAGTGALRSRAHIWLAGHRPPEGAAASGGGAHRADRARPLLHASPPRAPAAPSCRQRRLCLQVQQR